MSATETAQGMCEREGVSATEKLEVCVRGRECLLQKQLKVCVRGRECLLQKQLKVCVRGRGVSATETTQGMCEREGSVCYRNSSRYV